MAGSDLNRVRRTEAGCSRGDLTCFAVNEQVQAPPLPSSNCLYLGLSKEHRVSRTFRATWYLSHLNQTVEVAQVSCRQPWPCSNERSLSHAGGRGGRGHPGVGSVW